MINAVWQHITALIYSNNNVSFPEFDDANLIILGDYNFVATQIPVSCVLFPHADARCFLEVYKYMKRQYTHPTYSTVRMKTKKAAREPNLKLQNPKHTQICLL